MIRCAAYAYLSITRRLIIMLSLFWAVQGPTSISAQDSPGARTLEVMKVEVRRIVNDQPIPGLRLKLRGEGIDVETSDAGIAYFYFTRKRAPGTPVEIELTSEFKKRWRILSPYNGRTHVPAAESYIEIGIVANDEAPFTFEPLGGSIQRFDRNPGRPR